MLLEVGEIIKRLMIVVNKELMTDNHQVVCKQIKLILNQIQMFILKIVNQDDKQC